MRDDSGSSTLKAELCTITDGEIETRDGEAFVWSGAGKALGPEPLSIILVGGTSADSMLATFVLGELSEVGHVETASNIAAAAGRIASGKIFDLIFIDCDLDASDPAVAASRLLDATAEFRVPFLVLLASRFAQHQIDASGVGGPFAARLAKPLFVDQCRLLLRRLRA